MNGTLTMISNTLAYGDVGATSNPSQKYVDWSVSRSYPVKNPRSESFALDPGATVSLFDGLRSTAIDNTTEFELTLSSISSTRYRFSWTGVGTAPGLRTDRALALDGVTLTLTANANLTLTMTGGAGDFSSVQVGDILFIPDASTGDAAGPFSVLNGGYWTVLARNIAGDTVQLSRGSNTSFVGVSESVTVTDDAQVQAFSATGVQVGDKVTLSMEFPADVLNTYSVVAVTASWFEVVSTSPLPVDVTAVPTAAGIEFYSGAKRFIRFEADQECVIRLNGDTGNSNRLSPWQAADPAQAASFEKVGPVWSVEVVNLSSASLNLLFISAE